MKRTLIAVVAFTLLLAACASDDGGGQDPSESLPTNDAAGTEPADGEPIPTEPDGGIGDGAGPPGLPVISPELSPVVDLAIADLADRLGDDVLIEVLVAHELTWPNGALGCPQPDTSYTDALVDGYRIELDADGVVYHYHGAVGEAPFFCENPGGVLEEAEVEEVETGDRGTSDEALTDSLAAHIDLAIADLAERLGVDALDVRVMKAETVTWRDGSFGCPEPDMSYTQALVSGVRVLLAVEDESYWYHQGGSTPITFCDDPRDPLTGGGDE